MTTIRAHQADVRVDWSASNNDKIFGRFSYRRVRVAERQARLAAAPRQHHDAPFRNVAFNWNRIISPSLVNELLVGYNQIAIVTDTLDWAGIGDANATFGIAGGQPIAGLSSIALGQRPDVDRRRSSSDTDTLDKTYQINEKLTWLKGRHSIKFGGQFLHYVQQRFYAGNNGLLGPLRVWRRVHGRAVRRFPARPGGRARGAAAQSEPWTHLHNRIALFVQDDFKMTSALTLNLGLRWAYTQPVVEKDNRQSNFDLTHRPADSSRRTATARAARSTRPTRRASSRGSGSPGGPTSAGCVRGQATASPSTWRAPAPTCACRSTRRSSSNRSCSTT